MKLGGSLRPCGGADGRVDCVATATIRARARRGLGERGQLITAGKGPTWKVAHLRTAHSSGTPRRSNSCVIPEPGGRNGPRPPRGPWMFCWAYHLGPSRRQLRAPGLGVDAVAARCAQALGQQVRSRDGGVAGESDSPAPAPELCHLAPCDLHKSCNPSEPSRPPMQNEAGDTLQEATRRDWNSITRPSAEPDPTGAPEGSRHHGVSDGGFRTPGPVSQATAVPGGPASFSPPPPPPPPLSPLLLHVLHVLAVMLC